MYLIRICILFIVLIILLVPYKVYSGGFLQNLSDERYKVLILDAIKEIHRNYYHFKLIDGNEYRVLVRRPAKTCALKKKQDVDVLRGEDKLNDVVELDDQAYDGCFVYIHKVSVNGGCYYKGRNRDLPYTLLELLEKDNYLSSINSSNSTSPNKAKRKAKSNCIDDSEVDGIIVKYKVPNKSRKKTKLGRIERDTKKVKFSSICEEYHEEYKKNKQQKKDFHEENVSRFNAEHQYLGDLFSDAIPVPVVDETKNYRQKDEIPVVEQREKMPEPEYEYFETVISVYNKDVNEVKWIKLSGEELETTYPYPCQNDRVGIKEGRVVRMKTNGFLGGENRKGSLLSIVNPEPMCVAKELEIKEEDRIKDETRKLLTELEKQFRVEFISSEKKDKKYVLELDNPILGFKRPWGTESLDVKKVGIHIVGGGACALKFKINYIDCNDVSHGLIDAVITRCPGFKTLQEAEAFNAFREVDYQSDIELDFFSKQLNSVKKCNANACKEEIFRLNEIDLSFFSEDLKVGRAISVPFIIPTSDNKFTVYYLQRCYDDLFEKYLDCMIDLVEFLGEEGGQSFEMIEGSHEAYAQFKFIYFDEDKKAYKNILCYADFHYMLKKMLIEHKFYVDRKLDALEYLANELKLLFSKGEDCKPENYALTFMLNKKPIVRMVTVEGECVRAWDGCWEKGQNGTKKTIEYVGEEFLEKELSIYYRNFDDNPPGVRLINSNNSDIHLAYTGGPSFDHMTKVLKSEAQQKKFFQRVGIIANRENLIIKELASIFKRVERKVKNNRYVDTLKNMFLQLINETISITSESQQVKKIEYQDVERYTENSIKTHNRRRASLLYCGLEDEFGTSEPMPTDQVPCDQQQADHLNNFWKKYKPMLCVFGAAGKGEAFDKLCEHLYEKKPVYKSFLETFVQPARMLLKTHGEKFMAACENTIRNSKVLDELQRNSESSVSEKYDSLDLNNARQIADLYYKKRLDMQTVASPENQNPFEFSSSYGDGNLTECQYTLLNKTNGTGIDYFSDQEAIGLFKRFVIFFYWKEKGRIYQDVNYESSSYYMQDSESEKYMMAFRTDNENYERIENRDTLKDSLARSSIKKLHLKKVNGDPAEKVKATGLSFTEALCSAYNINHSKFVEAFEWSCKRVTSFYPRERQLDIGSIIKGIQGGKWWEKKYINIVNRTPTEELYHQIEHKRLSSEFIKCITDTASALMIMLLLDKKPLIIIQAIGRYDSGQGRGEADTEQGVFTLEPLALEISVEICCSALNDKNGSYQIPIVKFKKKFLSVEDDLQYILNDEENAKKYRYLLHNLPVVNSSSESDSKDWHVLFPKDSPKLGMMRGDQVDVHFNEAIAYFQKPRVDNRTFSLSYSDSVSDGGSEELEELEEVSDNDVYSADVSGSEADVLSESDVDLVSDPENSIETLPQSSAANTYVFRLDHDQKKLEKSTNLPFLNLVTDKDPTSDSGVSLGEKNTGSKRSLKRSCHQQVEAQVEDKGSDSDDAPKSKMQRTSFESRFTHNDCDNCDSLEINFEHRVGNDMVKHITDFIKKECMNPKDIVHIKHLEAIDFGKKGNQDFYKKVVKGQLKSKRGVVKTPPATFVLKKKVFNSIRQALCSNSRFNSDVLQQRFIKAIKYFYGFERYDMRTSRCNLGKKLKFLYENGIFGNDCQEVAYLDCLMSTVYTLAIIIKKPILFVVENSVYYVMPDGGLYNNRLLNSGLVSTIKSSSWKLINGDVGVSQMEGLKINGFSLNYFLKLSNPEGDELVACELIEIKL